MSTEKMSAEEAAREYLDGPFPIKEFENPYNYAMVINEHTKTFLAGDSNGYARSLADGLERNTKYALGVKHGKAEAEKRIWEACCVDVAQQDKGRLYLHELKQIIFGDKE